MTQPSTISLERPTPRIATITFSNAPANLILPETVIRLHEIVEDLSEDPDLQVLIFKSGLPDFFINHFDISAAADFPVRGTDDDAVFQYRLGALGLGAHRLDRRAPVDIGGGTSSG